MKTIILFLSLLLIQCLAFSQDNKVVRKAEQVNNETQQISETSDRVREQASQVAANASHAVENAKHIIRIFEPIFALHFKKKDRGFSQEINYSSALANTQPATPDPVFTDNGSSYNTTSSSTSTSSPSGVKDFTGGNKTAQPVYSDPGIPENSNYNSDGSANLGNQYNAEYGCFLDALTGTVLFGGEAEEAPSSIDLIFLAPNDGQNAYYLVTPNFAHDGGADCFWGSCTTDNPTRSWRAVNESEVALTTLTGLQFEKIQYNTQLSGAVKGTKGFSSWYSSVGGKMDGKVFAIKTEMDNRTAYALIYVVKQVGTSGSGGYLKIKVKVTGFDTNGDGNPDARVYENRN